MALEAAIRHLKKDSKLAEIIFNVGACKIRTTRNRYESLVEAIITQQLSGSAAKSISERFRLLYSSRFPKPIDVLKTSDSKLKKTGLSQMKVSYIKDLSKKISSKELQLNKMRNLSDEQVIEELIRVRGIGRWTAEMFLIFSLGRLDVLPVGDLGLKKGIKRLHNLKELPSEDKMKKIAEKWRPYRTIATWYLWKSLNNFDEIG
ncbi:DNA-3-methyladenine glycosylase 2 family protein [Nitrosopumilus sp. b1]|uniref:DNA-3-methyladenine glycosylase family protein n=1 Tax=Nitrosopumilus sp. b1 TaxID=2109907 RepID=UPI0015F3C237|nr:DNA-3-methyladenine glycosylase [Nitrosopumilus sp. b1]KAF6243542.1 DNA-3-methyladenine glycosylase 2 family protein [Nitrosopumilus sp. b1]